MRIKSWVTAVILLLAATRTFAQNTDSLKKEFAKAGSAKVQSRISYRISKLAFDQSRFDTSVIYGKKAAFAAMQAGYDTLYMEACRLTAHACRLMGSYNEALLYCDTAISYARRLQVPRRLMDFLIEKCSSLAMLRKTDQFAAPIREALNIALANNDKKSEARIYWVSAIYYSDLASYALQLDYANQSLAIYDSLKMIPEVADAYRLIGNNFSIGKKWREALYYYGIADSLYARLDMAPSRNELKMDVAVCYKKLGNYQRAISLYRAFIDATKSDDYLQMLGYGNLGIVLSETGLFTEARNSFAKALQLNKTVQEPDMDASIYIDLSKAFLRVKQSDSALYYVKLGEAICNKSSTPIRLYMECLLQLRDVHEARNDIAAALTYDKQYITLQDSMYRDLLRMNLSDAEARFGVTEKKKQLSALSEENELQKIKAHKQMQLNISLLVGLGLGIVIVVLIITAYRRSLRKNHLLAQQKLELQQQKDIIDTQVVQLASASKMKSKFLANISHELRTPVTLLKGMLELMSTDRQLQQIKANERLDIAYNNSLKLQQMVEEILDLTKLEHNRSEPVFEIKEIAPLLKRIVYAFETLMAKEQLVLEYDDERAQGLYLSVDTGKLEKVINNLLYNAIKFNRKGGSIKVSLYPDNSRTYLRIDVTDSGMGIAATDLPHIFEHFYQGASGGLKAAGAGIGLSLVKEFTTLMGGTVQVNSTLHTGTTFTLQYAIAAPPDEVNITQPNEASGKAAEDWTLFAARQKVLIVEDNEEMRYYLQEVLGDYVDVDTAGNGQEALAYLEQHIAGVIITDVMMPGMDGKALVSHLKQQDRFKKIPTITLTALADMETQLSFLRLGVDDYIVKPFNAEELRVRVYNLLLNQAERNTFDREPAEVGDVADNSGEADEFRQKVKEYVLARIKSINVSVTDLAYELAMSERQLYRLSKKLTGYTPAQLIKEIRLQKAHELLISGDIYKVEDVCRRVGYEKAGYFAQQFYERFGKRPSEFL